MVRHSRQITVGDTSREESVAVYRLTERGHRSLHDSLHKLDEAQRRKLEGQLDGALQPSFLQQP
jgi:DNA-binding PadR family transcriptional regulator